MSDIKKEYKKIIKELEDNIQDKKQFEYVKSQVDKITNLFIEEMDSLQNTTEDKIEKIMNKMVALEDKLSNVEKGLNNIEKDIYMEDDCDFQIVCPYCNYEFIIDCDNIKDEVQCPECNNTIELDWDGEYDSEESSCTHNCSCCEEECGKEKQDDKDDEEDM